MKKQRSFSRYSSGSSIIRKAGSVEEIQAVFKEATNPRRRVAIRASGHSFHDQALHDGDNGTAIVLLVDGFQTIKFSLDRSEVTLGAGVQWDDYFSKALELGAVLGEPLMIPASMQTGRKSTVGGTLAGNCLSRFSGTMGKESRSIVSFRLVTPSGQVLNVDESSNPDLFHAVIGGFGCLGFVLEATYKLVPVPLPSVAHTLITLHDSFEELVAAQLDIVHRHDGRLRAVSSAWYTDLEGKDPPGKIRGAVFESWLDAPSARPKPAFPLYADIDSPARYATEVLARTEPLNFFAHEALRQLVKLHPRGFENDLRDFMFFMDGNTVAKEQFERMTGRQFPIIQQTFVVPVEETARFAYNCERKMKAYSIRPTESDMLFVKADESLMSANYHMDGFAVSFGFEPLKAEHEPADIVALLDELTQDCIDVGGRLHLVKNSYANEGRLRRMFASQIARFKTVKLKYDPNLILGNTFSDRLGV